MQGARGKLQEAKRKKLNGSLRQARPALPELVEGSGVGFDKLSHRLSNNNQQPTTYRPPPPYSL
ncbi:hypothetical protein DCC62_03305 [candidate division KSB1 bacterium]|nr:MAG: hypothetical protein DCC62_03305 [candidate division KSB1 bacterium]